MVLALLADASDITVGSLLFPLSLRDALAIALELALDVVGSQASLSVSVLYARTDGWMMYEQYPELK